MINTTVTQSVYDRTRKEWVERKFMIIVDPSKFSITTWTEIHNSKSGRKRLAHGAILIAEE